MWLKVKCIVVNRETDQHRLVQSGTGNFSGQSSSSHCFTAEARCLWWSVLFLALWLVETTQPGDINRSFWVPWWLRRDGGSLRGGDESSRERSDSCGGPMCRAKIDSEKKMEVKKSLIRLVVSLVKRWPASEMRCQHSVSGWHWWDLWWHFFLLYLSLLIVFSV